MHFTWWIHFISVLNLLSCCSLKKGKKEQRRRKNNHQYAFALLDAVFQYLNIYLFIYYFSGSTLQLHLFRFGSIKKWHETQDWGERKKVICNKFFEMHFYNRCRHVYSYFVKAHIFFFLFLYCCVCKVVPFYNSRPRFLKLYYIIYIFCVLHFLLILS